MNTTEYKKALHKRLGGKYSPPLTYEDVSLMVDMSFEVMEDALNEEDEEGECKLVMRGLGTLRQVIRKGRTFNVRGKQVTVGPRKTVTFKPGTGLAKRLTDE